MPPCMSLPGPVAAAGGVGKGWEFAPRIGATVEVPAAVVTGGGGLEEIGAVTLNGLAADGGVVMVPASSTTCDGCAADAGAGASATEGLRDHQKLPAKRPTITNKIAGTRKCFLIVEKTGERMTNANRRDRWPEIRRRCRRRPFSPAVHRHPAPRLPQTLAMKPMSGVANRPRFGKTVLMFVLSMPNHFAIVAAN